MLACCGASIAVIILDGCPLCFPFSYVCSICIILLFEAASRDKMRFHASKTGVNPYQALDLCKMFTG